MNLKNSFILKTKYLQLILTYAIRSLHIKNELESEVGYQNWIILCYFADQ